jgi:hypothetical protein
MRAAAKVMMISLKYFLVRSGQRRDRYLSSQPQHQGAVPMRRKICDAKAGFDPERASATVQ